MEPLTTIKKLLSAGKIVVPDYQRAYSWDTGEKDRKLQVGVFISDLEEYLEEPLGECYFGHFLFERTQNEDVLAVVDGQQRLTTITIFLAKLFERLKEIRALSEGEIHLEQDMLKRDSLCRFETVGHDRVFFKEYVLEGSRTSRESLSYLSMVRIADAADYFKEYLKEKKEDYLLRMLEVIKSAKCTTHEVSSSAEAVQMFLAQNNRGKKPTRLEIVKALLIRAAYSKGGKDRDELIRDIVDRFAVIYSVIAAIENYESEDSVLSCAMRLYKGTLYAEGSISEIEDSVKKDGVVFVRDFVGVLARCFEHLKTFYMQDAGRYLEAHALRALGCGSWTLPFVAKCYEIALPEDRRRVVWRVLESLLVRDWLIGTRAYIVSRVNDVFGMMDNSNADKLLCDRLAKLRTSDEWWWSYWSDEQMKASLNREMGDRGLSKYLLWRYENYLVTDGDQQGYDWKRYEEIVSPELEHIAPQTESGGNAEASGYGKYVDEEVPDDGIVSGHWLDSIGNHLILPKSHNCQVGNRDFKVKYDSYTHTESQHEVREIVDKHLGETKEPMWTKGCIQERRDNIVKALVILFTLSKI